MAPGWTERRAAGAGALAKNDGQEKPAGAINPARSSWQERAPATELQDTTPASCRLLFVSRHTADWPRYPVEIKQRPGEMFRIN